MKSRKELIDERNELLSANEALLNKADADKRSLTDDERSTFDANDSRIATLATEIKGVEDDERRREQTRRLRQEVGNPEPLGRQTNPAPHIGRQRLAAEDDPKRGFKTPREFLSCVMEASRTGRLDERLNLLKSNSQSLAAGSDEHGTYSDPYGGFFVPVGFMPETLRLDPEGNPMAGLVRSIPMTNPIVSFNARVDKNHSSSVSGGLRVYRRKETQTVSSSRMEHEQVELKANSVFGVAYASEELLSRSMVSFVSLLEAGFSDEFQAKLVNERLNGTGVGEYEGILNSPCLITVSKETGQSGSTIVKNNIDKMEARCWRYSRAVWLANHKTLPQLKSLVQEIGTAGVAVPYFQYTPDGRATLNGRPLFFTEFCPTLGTVGDLILGVWSEYLEGTLTGMNSAESMHVRFLEHERTFKFWMENDARCWWRSALTPKNGDTLSPFVVLQTRS